MIPLQQTIWEYWDQLKKCWREIRHDFDAATVHKFRSASRRILSALVLLEAAAGTERPSKARRRIKHLIRKLGPLRDVQVQIAIVEKWQTADPRFRKSLKALEKKERRRAQRYLTAARRRKIHRSLEDFQRLVEKCLRVRPEKSIQTEIKIALNAQRRSLTNALKTRPSDPGSLHFLRKIARRLRYSLEAAASTIGRPPKSESHRLRRYQTNLGRQRDLQLVQDRFDQWRRTERLSSDEQGHADHSR